MSNNPLEEKLTRIVVKVLSDGGWISPRGSG